MQSEHRESCGQFTCGLSATFLVKLFEGNNTDENCGEAQAFQERSGWSGFSTG